MQDAGERPQLGKRPSRATGWADETQSRAGGLLPAYNPSGGSPHLSPHRCRQSPTSTKSTPISLISFLANLFDLFPGHAGPPTHPPQPLFSPALLSYLLLLHKSSTPSPTPGFCPGNCLHLGYPSLLALYFAWLYEGKKYCKEF